MKIILSQAGGGKTTKVAELAAKYTQEEKFVQIISNEVFLSDFQQYIEKEKVDTEYLSYRFSTKMTEIVSIIMENSLSEVVLMDGIYSSFNDVEEKRSPRENIVAKIKFFKAIEEYTGKETYVTVQANMNSDLLNGEKLAVLDYDDYLELSK